MSIENELPKDIADWGDLLNQSQQTQNFSDKSKRTIEKNQWVLEEEEGKKKPIQNFNSLLVMSISLEATRIWDDAQNKLNQIYEEYEDVLIGYLQDYFSFTIYGLERETVKSVSYAKNGLILYTYWAAVCPDWNPNGKSFTGKPLPEVPDSFLQKIWDLLHTLAPKIFFIDHEKWAEKIEENPDWVPDIIGGLPTLIPGLKNTNSTELDHAKALQVTLASVLTDMASMKNKPIDVRRKGLKNIKDLFARFIYNDEIELPAETLDAKTRKRLHQMYPGIFKCKTITDVCEPYSSNGDAIEALKSGETDVIMDPGIFLCRLSTDTGINIASLNISKQDENNILYNLNHCTLESYVDEDGERGYTNEPDDESENEFSFRIDEYMGEILAFSTYVLSNELSKQAKEKITLILCAGKQEASSKNDGKYQGRAKKAEEALANEKNLRKSMEKRALQAESDISGARSEITRLKDKTGKLEDRIRRLEEKLRKSEAENKRLSKDLEEVQEKYESAAGVLDALFEDEPEEVIEAEEITKEALDIQKMVRAYLKDKSVIIFGGNQHMMKKVPERYPEIKLIQTTRSVNFEDLVRNADLILFKYESISHPLFYRAKNIATQYNVPFGYLEPVTNLEMLDNDLLRLCQKYLD